MTNDNVFAETVCALNQKDRVAESEPRRPSRMMDTAQRLGRRGQAQAEAELLNEALMKLIELCYSQEHGRFINLDPVNGRLVPQLPVPWNSKNFKRYGLTRREQADLLRWVMLYYSQRPGALFRYSKTSRRWHVDLAAYPSRKDALDWMRHHEMTAKRWLSAQEKLDATSRTPAHIRRK